MCRFPGSWFLVPGLVCYIAIATQLGLGSVGAKLCNNTVGL